MRQIYGQWEESSIPTITPGAGIKLTICNLNRLNTPASREHNQPGRGPEEINSQTVFLSPLSPFLSRYLLVHPSLTFSYRLSALVSDSLALTSFHSFLHLRLCFSSLAVSPFLSSTRWHLTWQRPPLSKEWNHLPGNGLQPSTMADWRLVSLLDLTLCHPLFSPLRAQIRLMTSLSRCSHSGPCPVTSIHSPVASSVLSHDKSYIFFSGLIEPIKLTLLLI